MNDRRVLIVGGGITGLTVASEILTRGLAEVELREADERLGGKIQTSPFAGLAAVDEGPDAFLTRVPEAMSLSADVGLGHDLTSPTSASAAVWYPGRRTALHPIPEGLVLGVPARFTPLARTQLLTWRAKLRAAVEPLLPRTPTDPDSLGRYVRRRLGDQVHERLVDALVGSIYAADTDRSSLQAVPQLAVLAEQHRSLLLGARAARARAPRSDAPIFAAPTRGMGALVQALADQISALGGSVSTSRPVAGIEPDGTSGGWLVDGDRFDEVVVTAPARASAPLLATAAADAARLLGRLDHADVVMVTLAVPGEAWPQRLTAMSGYLVPKPVQRLVTAASFGSQKWTHWQPPDGSQVLRVSLGRDGLPVDHLDDDAVVAAVVDEVGSHLSIDVQPSAVRISRWAQAFPQYRPGHHRWVDQIERSLPTGLHLAGASYHGIGIPACIRDARRIVERIASGRM